MLRRTALLVGSLLGVLLLGGQAARAGDWWSYWHCPKPSYSPLHYWAPEAYCAAYELHHPRQYLYAPPRYPEVPNTYRVTRFPCPAVPPAAFPYSWPFLNIKPPAPETPADAKAEK